MRVVIAGGHGKIALLLERLLAGRGDQAVGLIRNTAHAADVWRAQAGELPCRLAINDLGVRASAGGGLEPAPYCRGGTN